MNKLSTDFYQREDVVKVSRELLGKRICSRIDGKYCSAIISETEAYAGSDDKASHAYGGKRSKRTKIMYANGGVAYVYLCYGIHFLFNVVSNRAEVPHACLIRAVIPEEGISTMLKRRGLSAVKKGWLNGPGKVSQAMGFNLNHNAIDLQGDLVWLERTENRITSDDILISKRIGIDYAEEDAELPYRFTLK